MRRRDYILKSRSLYSFPWLNVSWWDTAELSLPLLYPSDWKLWGVGSASDTTEAEMDNFVSSEMFPSYSPADTPDLAGCRRVLYIFKACPGDMLVSVGIISPCRCLTARFTVKISHLSVYLSIYLTWDSFWWSKRMACRGNNMRDSGSEIETRASKYCWSRVFIMLSFVQADNLPWFYSPLSLLSKQKSLKKEDRINCTVDHSHPHRMGPRRGMQSLELAVQDPVLGSVIAQLSDKQSTFEHVRIWMMYNFTRVRGGIAPTTFAWK